MTDAFTEHKPRCPKCKAIAIVDRENNIRCPKCGYEENPKVGEECIICGESGGFYLHSGPTKAGPYCGQHRWELGVYVTKRNKQICESKFNEWVDEFQRKKQALKAKGQMPF